MCDRRILPKETIGPGTANPRCAASKPGTCRYWSLGIYKYVAHEQDSPRACTGPPFLSNRCLTVHFHNWHDQHIMTFECISNSFKRGTSEAVLTDYFATAKLVVLVGIGGNVRLGGESFTHAPQKMQADPDEAPEAEPASWYRRFVRRLGCIGGGLLVLGLFEAGWLVLVRMVVGVTESDSHSKVPAPTLRIFL